MPDTTSDLAKARLDLTGAASEVANAPGELDSTGGPDPKACAEYVADAQASLARVLAALGSPRP